MQKKKDQHTRGWRPPEKGICWSKRKQESNLGEGGWGDISGLIVGGAVRAEDLLAAVCKKDFAKGRTRDKIKKKKCPVG